MNWDEDGPRAWGPYAVTAGCALTGFGVRFASGPAGVAVAAMVPLAAAGIVAAAHQLGRPLLGVDRALEVGYVAGLLAALSGWTVACGAGSWPLAAVLAIVIVGVSSGWVAYGPWRRVANHAVGAGVAAGALSAAWLNPLGHGGLLRWLVAWLAGTTMAAVPYWLHLRRRRRNAPTVVDVTTLTTAIIKHLRHDVSQINGSLNIAAAGRYSLRYRLTDGQTADDVHRITAKVESELGLRPGAVMVAGTRHRRDEVTVSVTPEAPTVEAVMPKLPTSVTQPAPLGLHDDGAPLLARIYTPQGASGAILGGRKGSGKSRALWTWFKSLTRCEDVLIFFADLSGGATSNPWLPCLTGRITDPERFKALVSALLEEATARAAILAEKGWESWQPSKKHPAVVFAVDEAQRALKDDWATRTALDNLMQVDRKSGISVILMCPNPVVLEGITPTMREMSRIRMCFASAGQAVKWVLEGTPAAAVAGVVLDFDEPGQVLAVGPGIAAVQARTYDTDLAEATAVAREHAQYRPAVTGLLTDALRAFAGAGLGAVPEPEPVPPTPGGGQPPATGGATDGTELRDVLRRMTEAPDVLGRPWPDLPSVPPRGRLSQQDALRVAAAMVAQKGGTSPAAIMAATGRQKTWTHDTLGLWESEGLVRNVGHGKWVAVAHKIDAA